MALVDMVALNALFADDLPEDEERGSGCGGGLAIIMRVEAEAKERMRLGRARKKAERKAEEDRRRSVREAQKTAKKNKEKRAAWREAKQATRRKNLADGVAQVWSVEGGVRTAAFIPIEEWRAQQSAARKRQRAMKALLDTMRAAEGLRRANANLALLRDD